MEKSRGKHVLEKKRRSMKTFRQYITESTLDITLRKLGLKRTNKFSGVGKEIGGNIYCHKMYESQFPQEELRFAKSQFPENFTYNIIKYAPRTNVFSFISSLDFNTIPEPSVNGGITVKANGEVKPFGDHGWIYHHKWQFVSDDYTGFDVEESKKRSIQWTLIANEKGIDKSKIGQRKFWNEEMEPYLLRGM